MYTLNNHRYFFRHRLVFGTGFPFEQQLYRFCEEFNSRPVVDTIRVCRQPLVCFNVSLVFLH